MQYVKNLSNHANVSDGILSNVKRHYRPMTIWLCLGSFPWRRVCRGYLNILLARDIDVLQAVELSWGIILLVPL